MASFCPSTTITHTISSTSSFCPSFPGTSQLSLIKKRNYLGKIIPRVSCQSRNNDDDHDNHKNPSTRRDILIGLGGLCGATSFNIDPLAFAKPIQAPDLTKCGKANLPQGVSSSLNCCPPPSTSIKDFNLIPSNAPLRVRPAAHLVDDAYLAKYTKAVELMKALPADDPRSFQQQANVHCAYCDGAHDQVGFPGLDIQVHDSWLFFPFHRYYLYFHEKILGKLIDDPTFALPFWNWDSPDGMQMPAIYTDPSSPLYDQFRDQNHLPPATLDLDYDGSPSSLSDEAILSSNLTIMYRQMVSNGKTASLFLGRPYRAGNDTNPGGGSVENIPHGPVHVWTGDINNQPNGEDMGNFYSAARDPIFFAHHANVDRTWALWKTLGGSRRTDFTDPDWLDAAFVFYDENANPVRVKVRDCLDTRKLGYVYQDVDIPWLQSRPTPKRMFKKLAQAFSHNKEARAADHEKKGAGTSGVPITSFPLVLDRPVSTLVRRPKKSRSKKEKEEKEEILVIEGIEFDRTAFVKFDVFVNDEDDSPTTKDKTEFAGSFVNVPHRRHHKHGKKISTELCLGLTDLIDDLKADDDDSVVVTLVPKSGSEALVKIGGIRIVLGEV
ncbi:hypothetical protein Tsubulata_017398 [Turnera subulata]|uniref:Tyrosinase copper-binding domain-containing protein n=1 Tax=Turnera subulata TaxID=218843 RepID=A0A9Q0G5V1_9ROSI|nr:hypothetical protein Tsubulata_017398 [Turnera subulata]